MNLPLVEQDDLRLKEWETASSGLARIGGHFPFVMIGLARLDCFLRKIDHEIVEESFGPCGQPDSIVLEDFLTLSKLWVFGAYEFLRSLDEHLGKNCTPIRKTVPSAVNEAKKRFARIRVPLAKFQP